MPVLPHDAQLPSAGQEQNPSARVGTTVREKWRIDALIGAGGMAAVYAATHRNGQRVALKILHTVLASDSSVKDRFLREGYVANSVGHSGCVAVLDDDLTEDGAPFLVMELLEGDTLRDVWKKGGRRMPPVQALQLMDPVLDCLAACHAAGVIHRDLKPPNIFVTKQGQVKILDFGVAQLRTAASERTRAGTTLGTPHYMSPEQAMGLVDQLDGRADLFSAGAILHALITGQRIHNARTENEALILAATTPVPSVARIAPDLPVDVIRLIDKSLCWDRRNRHADAKVMQADLRKVLAGLGASVPTAETGLRIGTAVAASVEDGEYEELEELEELEEYDEGAEGQAAEAEQDVGENFAEEAAADDPRVLKMAELFKQIERLLPNVRQMGWEHPATNRALMTAFQQFADALQEDEHAVSFTCRPYSFLKLGQTVWEPSPPFDGIPYNLFECGIREMRIRRGVTQDEFRGMLELWMLDPSRDLPPEDDLAAAFWDRGLEHVECLTVDVFAEGGAGERETFLTEAGELERHAVDSAMNANAAEAKAMAVSTDRKALKQRGGKSVLAIDGAVRASLEPKLQVPREQWSDRYVRVLAAALVDAEEQGDSAMVYASLAKSSADLIVAGRLGVVLTLREALLRQLQRLCTGPVRAGVCLQLDRALLGGEALSLAIEYVSTHPGETDSFGDVLATLDAEQLPLVLQSFKADKPERLREAMLRYLEQAIPRASEEAVVGISELDPAVAAPVLAVLKRAGTASARNLLANLARSKDPTLRIEAQVLAAETPEALHGELTKLCADSSVRVRMAAYRVLSRHQLRAAAPAIVRQIKAPSFQTIEQEERRELYKTLLVLSSERGEDLALEAARKGGLITSEAREVLRAAAIDALGEVSRSRTVAAALREVAQSRWGTSEDTRSRAAAAAGRIEERASSGARAEGAS